MTPLALALATAQRRLLARLQALDQRLDGGDDAWPDYIATLTALVALIVEPERSGRPVSAAELAAKFGVSPKTISRRRRKDASGRVLRPA
jgi:hypothetical protein